MPRQAVALKKYRCGSSPVSKMSDNEHTPPALGNSEVLSVKSSPGEGVSAGSADKEAGILPSFWGRIDRNSREGGEEGREVMTAGGGENSRDVFPDDPSRSKSVSQL